MTSPLLVRLARSLTRPVGEGESRRARLHLLDWLACVAGARKSLPPGAGRTWGFHDAAAYLGNVLEMDDVHRTGRLHPGPVIWPAALLSAGSMREALDAAVRGYEAMIAIGDTLDAWHYAHYHPTATAGVFGAAAASASALGLKEVATQHALALAGSVAGGLWQMRHEPVTAKQWHSVHAFETGRRAALMAQDGVTGPATLLEGEQGLYAAITREPKPMRWGDGWRNHEVSFKPWAACRHAHPAIDCALELRAAGKLAPPFRVETYRDAVVFCDRPNPVTELDAKFSLQHAVAVIADGRGAKPEDFTAEAIAALAGVRARVEVAEAPEITARYPDHFGARVNGLELADCRGDPERPVGEAEIVAKMHDLANWGGLPAGEAGSAVDLALAGEDVGGIQALLERWLA